MVGFQNDLYSVSASSNHASLIQGIYCTAVIKVHVIWLKSAQQLWRAVSKASSVQEIVFM